MRPIFCVVSVYILNLPSHLDRVFDYYVPHDLADSLLRGSLVTVPFGGGNRHVAALTVALSEKEEIEGLKPIVSVSEIRLSEEELGLIFFLKEHTFCSIGDAYRTVLPQSTVTPVSECYLVTDKIPALEEINQKAYLVYTYIRDHKKPTLAILKNEYGSEVTEMLKSLTALGYIRTYSEIKSSSNKKNLLLYSLAFSPDALADRLQKSRLKSPFYRKILDYIAEHGTASSEALRAELAVEKRILNTLVEKGFLCEQKEENYRDPYRDIAVSTEDPPLTACQKNALSELLSRMDTGKPEAVLLHGVTGSGKTRVIKEAIDHVLKKGRQVILLVPEIALTPQTVAIFCSYYRDRVAVIHSSLSAGERYDAWRRIRNGDVSLCIGTRSAVFAPFPRLGMIVVDEEHEHTYKSEQNPRYHAVDVARFRVAHHKALLLLSSATPSLESYYKAENKLYHLVEMNERAAGTALPETLITDLRADAASGNTSPIGRILKDALIRTLADREQSIFFINRRGYNNFLNCPLCGTVVTCPHCSVSLTHHIRGRKSSLVCHYCGYTQDIPSKCPSCGSEAFAFIGFGTQYAEDTILRELPDARVMRMDADTTTQKFSYDRMLAGFRSGQADILLGTQMVTKGHDFPNVTLVGVLLADTTLYLDDYRANERTFQLITQVIGRAGRSKKNGRAVIQTYNPDHPALLMAAAQDYKAFYREEIAMRRALVFPPFCDMVLISLSSRDETYLLKTVTEVGNLLKKALSEEFSDVKLILFGPFEAPIYKVKETYRMRFVIKCKNNRRTRALYRKVLEDTLRKFGRRAVISIDINPNSL